MIAYDGADDPEYQKWLRGLTASQRRHLPRCDVDRCHPCPLLDGDWFPGCYSRAHNPDACSCPPPLPRPKTNDAKILAAALSYALTDGKGAATWSELLPRERRRAEELRWQFKGHCT